MIVQLTGQVLERQPPALVLNVNGVGYQIEAPLSVFDRLPALGETVTVLTELIVREDAHTLYGFMTTGDRQLFRRLLKVSGIGPRLALGILSSTSADQFALMIEAGDIAGLVRLPGIGKKTAERIIVEMRGKLSDVGIDAHASTVGDAAAEARQALTSLGYSASEALKMVQAVAQPDVSAEALIRAALKEKMRT
jgi:Holliday junction DNA helicase RuvA